MSRSLNPMNGGDFIHDDERKLDGGSVLSRLSLANKTAIITGAGGGIGYSVAVAYAEMGCSIAIWYHTNREAPKRAEELSEKYKVKCKAYQVDVRLWEAVEKATDQAVADLNGRLDIFVANSGVPWTQGPMIDSPLEQYKDVIQTDLDGVYYYAKAAAKHWRRQKLEGKDVVGKPLDNFNRGSFIATASAGVIHLCKSLAAEWAIFARANSVSPGYIITDITTFVPQDVKELWKDKVPMGRQEEAHELQGAFLYFASDLSTYTSGETLVVDGGYHAV
ncbi:L-xylulose reductase [Colletotrichum fructicola]|uniref:L-xylulose reductase n=1 Tax=Colletotrichum fructicola (strain Nara gc5) TaxID=1213859 RepID=L2FZQ5_COLFN|nr:uncharacterized protein CGMCC3_g1306 [Colletotrichum fructicola]KAF4480967.1 L-xylulose reductase [Colletotrichum fructicola Nara gc5]KAE9583087.1 hypothetical protein CGMCC3_g1306 [Colletotrichum fructicola]KAF4887620.1 L-xylulose reductase [Colletotrichum fructicola]KAF4905637.1 L-xylulose reductase [Colletotrichum fructicola]KAF4935390.1 L-xylulose reductase [Colletotrichum fructicola]